MNKFKGEVSSELKSFKEELCELNHFHSQSKLLTSEICEELAALRKENADLSKKNSTIKIPVGDLKDT